MPGGVAVAKGYRFALLAVAQASGNAPHRLTPLDARWAVTNDLPDGVLDEWESLIGKRHRWELERTGLFLWALQPPGEPPADLRRAVLRLYYGFLVAVPFFHHGRMTLFRGTGTDGGLEITDVDPYHRTWSIAGSPTVSVTSTRVRAAHNVAEALAFLDQSAAWPRFDRILRTFREGCEAPSGDERLHQFVRCTEGFVVPWNRAQYRDRMAEFCVGRARRYLEELYSLRGSVEHLRGPYRGMPKGLTHRRQLLRLFSRAMLAEVLARTLIMNVLMQPHVWPEFETFDQAEAFWKRKKRSDRRSLLPVDVNVLNVLATFDVGKAEKAMG